MKKHLTITFLFFLLLTGLQAQEIVRASLDSTAILIGDQVGLHLRISNATDIQNPSVNLDPLKEVAEIEIVSESNWDTLDIMGNRVLQKDLVLTSFDSGYYFVPSLIINYKKTGRSVSMPTSRLALSVRTLPVDGPEVELAPIKGIVHEPIKLVDILPYLIAILALVGGIAAYLAYKKRQAKIETPPPPPVILPAHEIAFKKLDKLKSDKLWQQGKIKEYQSSLTYIVREYLENRFEIQALEQTSDQILRDLKRSDIEENHRKQLREMFTMADLVKFAKAEPPVDANAKLMEYAEGFVRKTKKIVSNDVTDNE